MNRLLVGLSVVAATMFAAAAAQAQNPVNIFYGMNSPFLQDSARISMYSSGLIPTPPYFAIHPPVYYSCPVPRCYGWSPYAYPAYVMTPEVEPKAKPAMFKNPYVEESKPASDTRDKSARHTTSIPTPTFNPFVRSEKQLAAGN